MSSLCAPWFLTPSGLTEMRLVRWPRLLTEGPPEGILVRRIGAPSLRLKVIGVHSFLDPLPPWEDPMRKPVIRRGRMVWMKTSGFWER